MSWAEVKKINSNPLMPLDEFIESKMRYIASDNVLSVIANNIYLSKSEKEFLTKSMKHPGVLNVQISKQTGFAMNLFVYRNGTKILTIECESNGTSYSGNFEFDKGDVIKITAKAPSSGGMISFINLRGMVAFGDF